MFKQKNNWYLVGAFIVMALLFYSSSMTYQEQTSVPTLQRFLSSQPLEHWLSQFHFNYAGQQQSIDELGYYKFVEFLIRKTAHFSSYLLLAFFGYQGLKMRLKHLGLTGIVVWLSATGYAAFDESHQMFTGGRTPLFQDVWLDSCGALVMVVILMLVQLFKKRRKAR